jgi:hypothetical protein
LSTAGAFQMEVLCPPSLQTWSYSKLLLPVCLPEELVETTVLQK